MQPRDPSCPAPPPFFVRALIPIWRAIVRAYGKVSLGEVRAKHETHGLSALMKPCFAIFFLRAAGSSWGMQQQHLLENAPPRSQHAKKES